MYDVTVFFLLLLFSTYTTFDHFVLSVIHKEQKEPQKTDIKIKRQCAGERQLESGQNEGCYHNMLHHYNIISSKLRHMF